jgi:membrane protein implicated in regulation of membrane protease activity
MNALEQIVFWHWWVFGLGMLILEAFIPGAIFLWMGISAGVVGLLLLVIPGMGWEWQFLLFATLSVVSVLAWKKYRPTVVAADRPALNRRGEQYVGRSFTLREPIVNGVGKLYVDDTTWRISGADQPAGRKVQVTGVDGTTLRVEAVGE